MPFVSQAQQRKFAELVKQKKVSLAVYDEWLKATPDLKRLPERIKTKKGVTRRSR